MISTGYSFRHAVGKIPEVISRLKEIGWKAAPICDRVSTFGFNRWTKECKVQGLRPVYGVSLPVATASDGDDRSVQDYWRFLATNSLRSLHDLIGTATSQEGELDYRQACAFPGIKIAGERCQLDCIRDPKTKDLYIGLSPATPKGLFTAAKKRGFKFLACSDNVYPRKEDSEFYRITLGKRANTQTYSQWILSDKEWRQSVQYIADKKDQDAALKNRDAAMASCQAVMKKATMLVPEKPKTLRQMCEEGAKRLKIDLKDPVYKERLAHELKTIKEKDFEDYFRILSDMMLWAREHLCCGPARGSSAGSLVCYLTGITAIDPIPYKLLFSRFLDESRTDPPDCDVDLDDQRRQLVFNYMEEKYGKDHIAKLGTVTMFKPTSALNAAGVALQIPKWQVSKVLDGVIERSSGDSRAMNALEDTMTDTEAGRQLLKDFPEVKIAGRLEGHPNNSSTHAAGIIITQEPINEYVAVDKRSKSAMVDKKDAEDLNLLKIDALGLTQLSIFGRVMELLGKPNKSGWLETLPLDDEKAFDVLNKGHWAGIFQFNGGALQSLAKQVKIDKLNDIVSITALARPGSMATGGANSWVKRRTGKEEVTTAHPMLTELTKDTYGIIVMQEQVMNVVHDMGKFSWADTSAIRKAMSGRLGNEFFERYRLKFLQGAKSNGITESVAEEVWNQIHVMGSWCLSGNTEIKIGHFGALPGSVKISKLYDLYEENKSEQIRYTKAKPWLVSLFPDGKGRPQISTSIIKSGKKKCWRYLFDDGSEVVCTKKHKFIINGNWEEIGSAKVGDKFSSLVKSKRKRATRGTGLGHAKGKKVFNDGKEGFPSGAGNPAWENGSHTIADKFRKEHLKLACEDCTKKKRRMEVHHNDFCGGLKRPKDLSWLCDGCHRKRHKPSPGPYSRPLIKGSKTLKACKYVGLQETYDISMSKHHNFALANGLVTHNSFNLSHAVSYGIVSYWCLYLKAYYPMEFAAATLDAEADPARQIALLRELKGEGIDYVAVDPDHSTDRWVPVKKGKGPTKRSYLVGPLTAIKGIGSATVMKILEARKAHKPLPPKLAEKLKEAKTGLDTLYPIADRVKQLHPDLAKINIVSTPTKIIDVQCDMTGPKTGRYGEVEVMIIGVVNKIAPKDENEQVNIMKREAAGRKGVLTGPTAALNMFVEDDSDEVFCKIDRFRFEEIGRAVVERGRAGKSLWAIKGTVPRFFRMVSVTAIKYLGDLEK